MSPPLHRFVEPGESQCSPLHCPDGEFKTPGRKESCSGAGTLRLRDSLVCSEPQTRGGECQASGAPVTSWLTVPRGSPGPLQARRAQVVSGRMGGLAKSSFRPPASRQTATPPASCCRHSFSFLPVIHICGDVQGVQREEGGEPPGGHDKGESFLKEHNLFSGNPRNWRSESQRLIRKVSPSGLAPGSPQTARGGCPAFSRVQRQEREAAGRGKSAALQQGDSARVLCDLG